MKNFFQDFGLGLIKFSLAWALVRLLCLLPEAANQDKSMLIKVVSFVVFAFLSLSFFRYDRSGLRFSANVAIATVFFYLQWGDFGLIVCQIALGSLLITSFFIFFYEIKMKKELWVSALINAVILIGFLYGFEEGIKFL